MHPVKGIITRWKRSRWSQHLDVVVGAASTLILYFPLANPGLAETIGVVTMLLGASKVAVFSYIEDRLEPVTKMTEVMDLTQSLTVSDLQDLSRVYVSIVEHEFRKVKESVVSEAHQKLKKLAQQKKSDELSTAEYYAWLLSILSEVRKGEEVRAISVMNPAEWDDSPAETRFFSENLAAVARGVIIQRIFVMPRARLAEALELPPVKSHMRGANAGLRGYFVDLDYLRQKEPHLLAQIGCGFIEIGARVALVDLFADTGQVRGQVTMDRSELRNLMRIFDKLQFYSHELSENLLAARPALPLDGIAQLTAMPSTPDKAH